MYLYTLAENSADLELDQMAICVAEATVELNQQLHRCFMAIARPPLALCRAHAE